MHHPWCCTGVPFVLLEASDGVGGRVRTDVVDGFRLDRGFQIFLTSYPECKVSSALTQDKTFSRRLQPTRSEEAVSLGKNVAFSHLSELHRCYAPHAFLFAALANDHEHCSYMSICHGAVTPASIV